MRGNEREHERGNERGNEENEEMRTMTVVHLTLTYEEK